MTKLHAGGKFGGSAYKISGGLHGVGASVVNALSEWMRVEVKRNNKIFSQDYSRGIAKTSLTQAKRDDKTDFIQSSETGTKVTFLPDKTIFTTTEFDYDILANRLKELA